MRLRCRRVSGEQEGRKGAGEEEVEELADLEDAQTLARVVKRRMAVDCNMLS